LLSLDLLNLTAHNLTARQMIPSKAHSSDLPGHLKLNQFRPGHIFWMAAGATWLNRVKPRPFALATFCSPAAPGTLIYGSTQETEKKSGAAWIEIVPIVTGLNRNGLRSRTYFYPGVLLLVGHRELPPHAGFLGRAGDTLKQVLRWALGVGQGSAERDASPPGSCRGRVVELNERMSTQLRTFFAIILTEHEYSRARNYQIVVPILDGRGTETGNYDVRITSRPWMRAFGVNVDDVLLPIPIAHSVWHADDIARETEYVVDDETLAEIDQRLCDYFSLPLADAAGDQR
jgi:hypothetical protein